MTKETADILRNQVFSLASTFERAHDDDKPKYAQATAILVRGLDRCDAKPDAGIKECLEKQLQLLSKAFNGDVEADKAAELAAAMVVLAETLEYY